MIDRTYRDDPYEYMSQEPCDYYEERKKEGLGMTNKEVINHLEFLKIAKQIGATPNDINVEALNIAIKALEERPIEPKRKFIRIITTYHPDDIVCYKEYKGKPYFSIEYQENGETIEGYGTYNPDVLSRFLRDYFFNER